MKSKILSIYMFCFLYCLTNYAQDRHLDIDKIAYKLPAYIVEPIEEFLNETGGNDDIFALLSMNDDTCQILLCDLKKIPINLQTLISTSNRELKLSKKKIPLILNEDLFFYEKLWGNEESKFGGSGVTRTKFMLPGRIIRFTIDNWGRGRVLYNKYFTP